MNNKEYEVKIKKYIDEYVVLRKKCISISSKIIGETLFSEDFYFIASADRCINLIDGMIEMLKTRNLTCVGVLLRMQMDNCMRTYAAFIAENKNEVVDCIISGERINKKKDFKGHRMTDGYLKSEITKIEPKFASVYENASGYVHLSEKAFYQTIDKVEDNIINFHVGVSLPERRNHLLIEAAEAFEHFIKLHYKMLSAVADSKIRYDSKVD